MILYFLDLAIRCLTRAIDNKSRGSNYGLVIAFCCHHKCEYKSYIGKEYLEQCKFLPNEFPILCSIASWATCGFNLKTDTELKDENKARYAQHMFSLSLSPTILFNLFL